MQGSRGRYLIPLREYAHHESEPPLQTRTGMAPSPTRVAEPGAGEGLADLGPSADE